MPNKDAEDLTLEQKRSNWTELVENLNKKFDISEIKADYEAKRAKFVQSTVKMDKMTHLNTFFASVDDIAGVLGGSKAPVSKDDPNARFKRKKARKQSESHDKWIEENDF